MPTEQFFNYIMARISYIPPDDNDGDLDDIYLKMDPQAQFLGTCV